MNEKIFDGNVYFATAARIAVSPHKFVRMTYLGKFRLDFKESSLFGTDTYVVHYFKANDRYGDNQELTHEEITYAIQEHWLIKEPGT